MTQIFTQKEYSLWGLPGCQGRLFAHKREGKKRLNQPLRPELAAGGGKPYLTATAASAVNPKDGHYQSLWPEHAPVVMVPFCHSFDIWGAFEQNCTFLTTLPPSLNKRWHYQCFRATEKKRTEKVVTTIVTPRADAILRLQRPNPQEQRLRRPTE